MQQKVSMLIPVRHRRSTQADLCGYFNYMYKGKVLIKERYPFDIEGREYGRAFPITIQGIHINSARSHEVRGEGQVDWRLPLWKDLLWRVWRAQAHRNRSREPPLHFGMDWHFFVY